MGRVEKIIVTWADLKNSRHEYQPTRNTSVLIFIFSPEASSGVFLRRNEMITKEIGKEKKKIRKRFEIRREKLTNDRFDDILDLLKRVSFV